MSVYYHADNLQSWHVGVVIVVFSLVPQFEFLVQFSILIF